MMMNLLYMDDNGMMFVITIMRVTTVSVLTIALIAITVIVMVVKKLREMVTAMMKRLTLLQGMLS